MFRYTVYIHDIICQASIFSNQVASASLELYRPYHVYLCPSNAIIIHAKCLGYIDRTSEEHEKSKPNLHIMRCYTPVLNFLISTNLPITSIHRSANAFSVNLPADSLALSLIATLSPRPINKAFLNALAYSPAVLA